MQNQKWKKILQLQKKYAKIFWNANPKMEKVFATTNKVCKSFDIKSDKLESLKIKMFCKCKLQTGKKFLQKWEKSFFTHKSSYLKSHLKLKPQTLTTNIISIKSQHKLSKIQTWQKNWHFLRQQILMLQKSV